MGRQTSTLHVPELATLTRFEIGAIGDTPDSRFHTLLDANPLGWRPPADREADETESADDRIATALERIAAAGEWLVALAEDEKAK